MGSASWSADPQDRYWLDVRIGSVDLKLMVDTGLVDKTRGHWLGIEIDPTTFDQLDRAGHFRHFEYRQRRDASGRLTRFPCGFTTARLLDPVSKHPIGPPADLFVARVVAGVPSRVGVAFFHRLSG